MDLGRSGLIKSARKVFRLMNSEKSIWKFKSPLLFTAKMIIATYRFCLTYSKIMMDSLHFN